MQGEGHFLALFRKEGRTDLIGTMSSAKPNAETRKWLELFLKEIGLKTLGGSPLTGIALKHERQSLLSATDRR